MSLFGFLKRPKACRLLADPEGRAARKYRDFKDLTEHNDQVLDALAALERTYYGAEPFTAGAARQACLRLSEAAWAMAQAVNRLSKDRYTALDPVIERLTAKALAALEPTTPGADGPPVLPLDRSLDGGGEAPETLLGGKAANLARVRRAGLPTPDGFVLTTAACQAILESSGLSDTIARELAGVSPLDLPDLEARSARIRGAALQARIPETVRQAVDESLAVLAVAHGPSLSLAVRSSAVGEDGAASFAGQYESILNVAPRDLPRACLEVLASRYSPRAILYRLRHGLDDADAPMAVLILSMVRARASGVLYTLDPHAPGRDLSRLDAVTGLADRLVSGEAVPEVSTVSRSPLAMAEHPATSPLDEPRALELARMGLVLERHFGAPQDVEWCLDHEGRLIVVQSRPITAADIEEQAPPPQLAPEDLSGARLLLEGGVTASPGAACGPALLVEGAVPEAIPEGAILVARNAAPELAALLDRAGGVVTAMGGAASHLASVAREMGVPALFGLPGVPQALADAATLTLDASGRRVFEGRVEGLAGARRPPSPLVDSPMHKRLRACLDHLSPLTLTDPHAPDFTPEGCKSLHDVVRFVHETAMREMFGLCEHAEDDGVVVARLKARIPLVLYCVDLGGGLRENLTSCDTISASDLRSLPMLAVWQGFTHPGITWSGTVAFNPRDFMTMVAATATSEVDGGQPGGDSYAMLGRDYMNLSARFGYHFANLDAYLGENAERNHVLLRFAGGAGGYAGKSLRVAFLARVLSSLGFTVEAQGDVLDASLKGTPAEATAQALDHLGRLLACSRLLDMAIGNQSEVETMAAAFLRGDYDLLAKRPESPLPNYHLTEGDWSRIPPVQPSQTSSAPDTGQSPEQDPDASRPGRAESETALAGADTIQAPPAPEASGSVPRHDVAEPSPDASAAGPFAPHSGAAVARQDGGKWATGLSKSFASLMGRVAGQRYQRFLDSVEAYFHFPLAVAKDSAMGAGRASLKVRPVAGSIDRAAGLAFAVKSAGTYLVLRVNALEDNVMLFEFLDGKRQELASAHLPVPSGAWTELAVEVSEAQGGGARVTGFVDGKAVLVRHFDRLPRGLLGLWTKADSVSDFAELTGTDPEGNPREYAL